MTAHRNAVCLSCHAVGGQVGAIFLFHQKEETVASWTSYGKAASKKSKATTW